VWSLAVFGAFSFSFLSGVGLMDFVSWFFVESKVFEFSVPAGGSILRLVERRKGISRVMMVGKYCVEWLKKVVEKMVFMVEDRAFTESSRDGNRAFFAQRGVNRAGCFLELAEYAVGGRKGLIIVPEGRDKRGWKMFAEELGKVMTAFDSSSGKLIGGCPQLSVLPLSGKEAEGPSSVGGGVKVSCNFGGLGLTPIVGGHLRSFAEVACAEGKSGVPLGKGKEVQAFEPLGKTQHAPDAGSGSRGSAISSSRVAEGNVPEPVSFPSDQSLRRGERV
jgi:hypothetical protein